MLPLEFVTLGCYGGAMQFLKQRPPKPSRQQFSSLMELYEHNYQLLRLILPEQDEVPDYWVSRIPGHLDLHLWVLERAKFTTTLRLSYQFNSDSRAEFEPDLSVRIYHDARSAEAMSAVVHGKPRQSAPQLRQASTLEWRWSLNQFLYRWLRYSRYQGHHFKPREGVAEALEQVQIAAQRCIEIKT